MNCSVALEFIYYLDRHGALECGDAPEHIKRWLEDLNLPVGLLHFMQGLWPLTNCEIARIGIMSSTSIYADEATGLLLPHRFINVGSAPNGDWFVIDFTTEACVPGFITHEEWSPWDDPPDDPRKFFQPIARSFESFLYRAVEDRYLPTDYYAARDFNTFVADERSA